LWLIICTYLAFELKGASFFIIPVYFTLVSLFILVRQKKPNIILMALLLFPTLLILVPFIKMFPVALGLKMIIATTLLVSLIFSLCISVFGFSRYKNRWSYILFFVAIVFFIKAHLNSEFNEKSPKPNSLVYVYDADNQSAIWATYDNILDSWTKAYLTDEPDDHSEIKNTKFDSKYKTGFTYSKKANIKPLKEPYIDIQTDTVVGDSRYFKIFISPQRHVNRIDLFTDSLALFNSFSINGLDMEEDENNHVLTERKYNRLFNYFVTDDNHLELEFSVPKNQNTALTLYESSFDMLNNELFRVPERPKDMIPKPFVLNDAVVIKKTIDLK